MPDGGGFNLFAGRPRAGITDPIDLGDMVTAEDGSRLSPRPLLPFEKKRIIREALSQYGVPEFLRTPTIVSEIYDKWDARLIPLDDQFSENIVIQFINRLAPHGKTKIAAFVQSEEHDAILWKKTAEILQKPPRMEALGAPYQSYPTIAEVTLAWNRIRRDEALQKRVLKTEHPNASLFYDVGAYAHRYEIEQCRAALRTQWKEENKGLWRRLFPRPVVQIEGTDRSRLTKFPSPRARSIRKMSDRHLTEMYFTLKATAEYRAALDGRVQSSLYKTMVKAYHKAKGVDTTLRRADKEMKRKHRSDTKTARKQMQNARQQFSLPTVQTNIPLKSAKRFALLLVGALGLGGVGAVAVHSDSPVVKNAFNTVAESVSDIFKNDNKVSFETAQYADKAPAPDLQASLKGSDFLLPTLEAQLDDRASSDYHSPGAITLDLTPKDRTLSADNLSVARLPDKPIEKAYEPLLVAGTISDFSIGIPPAADDSLHRSAFESVQIASGQEILPHIDKAIPVAPELTAMASAEQIPMTSAAIDMSLVAPSYVGVNLTISGMPMMQLEPLPPIEDEVATPEPPQNMTMVAPSPRPEVSQSPAADKIPDNLFDMSGGGDHFPTDTLLPTFEGGSFNVFDDNTPEEQAEIAEADVEVAMPMPPARPMVEEAEQNPFASFNNNNFPAGQSLGAFDNAQSDILTADLTIERADVESPTAKNSAEGTQVATVDRADGNLFDVSGFDPLSSKTSLQELGTAKEFNLFAYDAPKTPDAPLVAPTDVYQTVSKAVEGMFSGKQIPNRVATYLKKMDVALKAGDMNQATWDAFDAVNEVRLELGKIPGAIFAGHLFKQIEEAGTGAGAEEAGRSATWLNNRIAANAPFPMPRRVA